MDDGQVVEGEVVDKTNEAEVRRCFSEAWDVIEPSHRVEVLAKLRKETGSVARLWELLKQLWSIQGQLFQLTGEARQLFETGLVDDRGGTGTILRF